MRIVLGWKAFASPVAFGATAILDDEDGRVVLVRHSYQEGWHLPGGGIAAGEPPASGILRELREEIGLVRSDPPELRGLFTRRVGLVTNVVALYRVRRAEFAFSPGFEIREIMRADPASPPSGATAATRRRLAEFVGHASVVPYW